MSVRGISRKFEFSGLSRHDLWDPANFSPPDVFEAGAHYAAPAVLELLDSCIPPALAFSCLDLGTPCNSLLLTSCLKQADHCFVHSFSEWFMQSYFKIESHRQSGSDFWLAGQNINHRQQLPLLSLALLPPPFLCLWLSLIVARVDHQPALQLRITMTVSSSTFYKCRHCKCALRALVGSWGSN